jgi:hypothetical protein
VAGGGPRRSTPHGARRRRTAHPRTQAPLSRAPSPLSGALTATERLNPIKHPSFPSFARLTRPTGTSCWRSAQPLNRKGGRGSGSAHAPSRRSPGSAPTSRALTFPALRGSGYTRGHRANYTRPCAPLRRASGTRALHADRRSDAALACAGPVAHALAVPVRGRGLQSRKGSPTWHSPPAPALSVFGPVPTVAVPAAGSVSRSRRASAAAPRRRTWRPACVPCAGWSAAFAPPPPASHRRPQRCARHKSRSPVSARPALARAAPAARSHQRHSVASAFFRPCACCHRFAVPLASLRRWCAPCFAGVTVAGRAVGPCRVSHACTVLGALQHPKQQLALALTERTAA